MVGWLTSYLQNVDDEMQQPNKTECYKLFLKFITVQEYGSLGNKLNLIVIQNLINITNNLTGRDFL